jgi:hypothetical protein
VIHRFPIDFHSRFPFEFPLDVGPVKVLPEMWKETAEVVGPKEGDPFAGGSMGISHHSGGCKQMGAYPKCIKM